MCSISILGSKEGMRIETIEYELPSKVITNDDLVRRVLNGSEGVYKGNVRTLGKVLETLLKRTGSCERRILADDETPAKLMKKAFHRALTKTGWKATDIELVIYVGIGRGFIEPANSYMTAKLLGTTNAECFDIVDACMSWTRALYLVRQLMQNQQYKRVMIINAEFNWALYNKPHCWVFEDTSKLEYTFPGMTIGEAATVTLLSNDLQADQHWHFEFRSRPKFANLCTIPSTNFRHFYDLDEETIGKNGEFCFTSFGKALHDEGLSTLMKLFQDSHIDVDHVDFMFSHASSSRVWKKAAENVGFGDKYIDIFPMTGNIVSASVPTAMAMAVETGRLKRGHRVLGLVASAGMSFAVFHFNY